ncbi:peptide ABC transporter substrate-binding protein [Sphaerisporangium rufum]|uniref:Peptide ABC transporter substrate-binding protein n=1 Tax=Sphaerisporangium rufum TaxID=1381558 RepID=A0A919R5B0_9ACTN|nr:ABC transporter substrate-binding protein [Sphaerisporangium rufum]GII79929.1 peptide ABC transporter substrate-binding protein [Sphaerisporangium rufum]
MVYTGATGDIQPIFNPYLPGSLGGGGMIFESLFFYNIVRNEAPRPRLGESFSWNDDGTELSITLRSGVNWSDGRPFTAKDVVFTLNMIAKYKALNNTGYRGKATATDDTHVVIKFDEPSFLDGPQILGRIWIVPEHKWKDFPDPTKEQLREAVGTGPYLVDDLKPQAFTLKANPGYRDGEPAVKKIRFPSLSGNQSGATALKAGQIDWQTGPVPDIANVEQSYPGYKLIITPLNQMVMDTCANADLGCKGPQTDPAVRQAMYYAVNRTQLNALAFENTSAEISPSMALVQRDQAVMSGRLQNKVAPMQPDPAKAQQILESAGYAKGADGIYAKDGKPVKLTLKTVAGWTDYITAADTLSQQLAKSGIKVTAQQLSYNEWAGARQRGDFQLMLDSLFQGPAADPFYVYSYFYSTDSTDKVGGAAGNNVSRFSDPEVDKALAELKKIDISDTAPRQPYFDTIQTRIEQAMPYIPLLTQGTINIYNAGKFTGWPAKEDLYAFPAAWQAPDASEIYLRLKPTGK